MTMIFTPHWIPVNSQPAALAMPTCTYRIQSSQRAQLTLRSLGGVLQLHEAASHFRSQLGSSPRTACSTTEASELLRSGLLQGIRLTCTACSPCHFNLT